MSDAQPATTPDQATQAEEEVEAAAAHVAGPSPTPEEDAAAPDAADPGTSDKYREMTRLGAEVEGEGQTP